MANEKRLVDANALLSELEKFDNPMPNKSGYDFLCGVATAITEIENAPTVDAVEVVRCKDCKNGRQPWLEGQTMVKCMVGKTMLVTPEHFCSYGERRTDSGENYC